jgi:rRNA-processing protein FCF1
LTEVVFDSSFLMAVVETPTTWHEDMVDALGKFQPVLLECVKVELGKLASTSDKRARTARVALDLASGFKVRPCGGAAVDDEIISASASEGAVLATVDAELLRSANAAHLKVITLRSGRVALA